MKYIVSLLTGLFLLANAANAQFLYQEGKQYTLLPEPVATVDPNKVEVVEVFAYGCIHCYHFEPLIDNWLKTVPDNAVFIRQPAVFDQSNMMLQAQAFYTAEALGVLDKTHPAMFSAMHEQKNSLQTEEALGALFETSAGVKLDEFNKVFNSFGIKSRARQSMARMREYRITGTPSMVVNGKYLVSGKGLSGQEEILKVVNYLIAQEAQALRAKQAADKALSAMPAKAEGSK